MAINSTKITGNPLKQKAVQAALNLAVEKGWADVGLADIAGACELTLAELHDYFEDRIDILATYGRMIDRAAMDAVGDTDGLPPRDIVFDLMMTRFETLNENRAGVKAILQSFKCDPKQAVLSLPHLGRSMTWMLEAAGISTTGIKGAARVLGLTVLYLKTLYSWMDDEGADLSVTMAALDKNLSHAESLANTLRLGERA